MSEALKYDYLGPAYEHAMERMAEEARAIAETRRLTDEHATMRDWLRDIAGLRRWRTAPGGAGGGVLVTSAAAVKIAQGALMDIGEAVDFSEGGAA